MRSRELKLIEIQLAYRLRAGLFGCRPLGTIWWSQALASIGVSLAGSCWLPELQQWLLKQSERVVHNLRELQAEEEDLPAKA